LPTDEDMVLTKGQNAAIFGEDGGDDDGTTSATKNSRKRRAVGKGVTGVHIWPYGVVPYVITDSYGK